MRLLDQFPAGGDQSLSGLYVVTPQNDSHPMIGGLHTFLARPSVVVVLILTVAFHPISLCQNFKGG